MHAKTVKKLSLHFFMIFFIMTFHFHLIFSFNLYYSKCEQEVEKEVIEMKKRTLLIVILSTITLFFVYQIGQYIMTMTMFSHRGMGGGLRHHGGPRSIHHDFGIGGHPFMFSGWGLALLTQIFLIVLGIILWKTAKNNRMKKWLGISLLAIGMILLLPKIILIPLAIFVGYMAYRSNKDNKELSFSYDMNGQTVSSHSDYLDQWEKRTKMEE